MRLLSLSFMSFFILGLCGKKGVGREKQPGASLPRTSLGKRSCEGLVGARNNPGTPLVQPYSHEGSDLLQQFASFCQSRF